MSCCVARGREKVLLWLLCVTCCSVAVVGKEAKGLIDRKLEGSKAGRRVKKAEKKGKGAARVP